MNIDDFFVWHRLSRADVCDALQKSVPHSSVDLLFVTGSLAESSGNPSSDLDLYLVVMDVPAETQGPVRVQLCIGSVAVDVTIYSLNRIEALVSRFAEWSRQERDPRQSESFSKPERDLLHRITIGIAWQQSQLLERWQSIISTRALARLKFDISLLSVKRAQVDLVGLRHDRDWPSLLLVTHQLLWASVDAMLAAYNLTNVTEKWRFRLLSRVPINWNLELPGVTPPGPAVDFMLRLLQTPATLDACSSLEYAHKVAAVSRKLVAWSSWKVQEAVAEEPSPFAYRVDSIQFAGAPLPHLDLDVLCVYGSGEFQLRRLIPGQQSLRLDAILVDILCMYDGSTSVGLAEASICRRCANGIESFSQLRKLLVELNLIASPIIDEAKLRRLLE